MRWGGAGNKPERRPPQPSRPANGAAAAEDAGVRIIVCYTLGRGRCVPKPSSRNALGLSTLPFWFRVECAAAQGPPQTRNPKGAPDNTRARPTGLRQPSVKNEGLSFTC